MHWLRSFNFIDTALRFQNTIVLGKVRIRLHQSQNSASCTIRMASAPFPGFNSFLCYSYASCKKALTHPAIHTNHFYLFRLKIRNLLYLYTMDLRTVRDSLCIFKSLLKAFHNLIISAHK